MVEDHAAGRARQAGRTDDALLAHDQVAHG
jgi:hypothetical protein